MRHLDTLLLLALPASGKSEIRRYLAHVDPAVAARDFRIGPTVQLDDFPYVALMRLIDQSLAEAGGDRVFFAARDGTFAEPRDWGTLTRLIAEDYAMLGSPQAAPDDPTGHLLARFARARASVGAPPITSQLPGGLARAVAAAVEEDAAALFSRLAAAAGRHEADATVVVEFARGGPEGAAFPLPPPHGYGYSLPLLGPRMLERASILYVWVTPEQSRRRNLERAAPERDGASSTLHHRVPERVMRRDYGTDDLPWLIEQGDGSVRVDAGGVDYEVPVAVFDNRRDHTSFLRDEPGSWPRKRVDRIHAELRAALERLTGWSP